MSNASTNTIAETIRQKFNELTRAERQLANVLLENYPVSGMGSITAVAESAGVSTPTVVRMAQKLGFSGFLELQAALRGELEAMVSNPIAKHNTWVESAPDTHILNRFAEVVMDNLRQSLRQLDPQTFNDAAALIADPERSIHIVGGRITRALADYLFTHMQVIRPGVTLVAALPSTWPHYVLNMKAGDVLIVFDIRRYERYLQHMVEAAAAKGVKIIVFTDQWGSPATKFATHRFLARIEAPSAWDSSVVSLFVVEAMISAVETLTWSETQDRMAELENLLDQNRMFKKFT